MFTIARSRLRIVCYFALTASQGACMPKPPNNPKGSLLHIPVLTTLVHPCTSHPIETPLRGSLRYSKNNGRCGTRPKLYPILDSDSPRLTRHLAALLGAFEGAFKACEIRKISFLTFNTFNAQNWRRTSSPSHRRATEENNG